MIRAVTTYIVCVCSYNVELHLKFKGSLALFIALYNHYTNKRPIEIKNLFFKGDLAKACSSISTNIVTDRKHKRRLN